MGDFDKMLANHMKSPEFKFYWDILDKFPDVSADMLEKAWNNGNPLINDLTSLTSFDDFIAKVNRDKKKESSNKRDKDEHTQKYMPIKGTRPIMEQQERITLYYDDIEVTGYYGPIDWETGYPEYDYEEIISYEYDVDKNDIVELLIDKVYEDNPDIEDDEVEAYVIDNFDDLLDKYYDYVLDYYRKYATSEANETYNYEEEHSDDYYEEDYESDDEIDYLQEAGTHIEDMAKYKMDALTNEIDDLNQSLDDIVDSDYPDYDKRDSLANRLNSAQEDLIRLQDEFGYIIDKPVREFLENGEMTLREALNQYDYNTDNAYDLRSIYDCLEESVELNNRLTKAIMNNANAKTLYEMLTQNVITEDTIKRGNKCTKETRFLRGQARHSMNENTEGDERVKTFKLNGITYKISKLEDSLGKGGYVARWEDDSDNGLGYNNRGWISFDKKNYVLHNEASKPIKDFMYVISAYDRQPKQPVADKLIATTVSMFGDDAVNTDGAEINEDTVKIKDGKWANVGKDGKVDSGKFKTKKEADAQRKAMYANGYKGESLTEDNGESVYDKLKKYLAGQGVDLSKYE